MLVVRPMSSATRTRSTWSPNSPVHWKVRRTSRSMGGCWMLTRRPPDRCLRRSMQNIGGWSGFSGLAPVRWSRGAVGLAAMSSRCRPAEHRSRRMMVSRVGW